MIDSLEIIASCGQVFGLYTKIKLLNEGSCNQDQGQSLFSHFNQVCMFCTRPRYQVSVYMTIGPPVSILTHFQISGCICIEN